MAQLCSGIQTVYLWESQPQVPNTEYMTDRCWLCGGTAIKRGRLVAKGVNLSTFSDSNNAVCPASPMVCAACIWSLAGRPPNTLRLRSHYWDHTGQSLTPNRGEWVALLLALPALPCACSIAISGKKHLAYRVRICQSRDLIPVQFESEPLWVRRVKLEEILPTYEILLSLGCSRKAINSGAYRYEDLKKHGFIIQEFDQYLAPYRGTAEFRVTGYIARKPEKEKKQ